MLKGFAVLDDNCTLCLPNGERIKLNSASMRMLFEVEDLSVASPATVSRCGMVYVAEENISWVSHVHSWMQSPFLQDVNSEMKQFIQQLLEQHIPLGIRFLKQQVCRQSLKSVFKQCVREMLTFLRRNAVML